MRDAAARSNLQFPEGFIPFDASWLDEPIHRRFEQQVRLRPDAAAVRLPNRDVTYAELNAAANRAARRLLASADTAAKPVALLLDQGYASVVWTLAVLKAGLPYAPLDQRLPEPVLTSMLENLGPGTIVAGAPYRQLAYRLAAGRVSVIEVDPMCDGPHDASTAANRPRPEDVPPSADLVPSDAAGTTIDLAQSVAADSIAYIFYTSGSTGTPKGVADSHRNVLHNILRYTNTLRFAPGDTLSLIQNPSFSGTVSTLFGALLNGATLAPFDLHGEGLSLLSDWLRRARVTVFHAVPSIFRQLSDPVERFPDVRLIRLEGDRASVADLRHFDANFRAGCTLVNGLGATECGLVRQFFVGHGNVLESGEPVPVGYAVPDVDVRVCDDSGQSLPMGSIGELVIESRYLAVGYWRNPALTAMRFTEAGNDTRRYRTKDVGHVDADGCVTHLGRIDNAIRIAGEFVDPSAIERALLGIPGVAQTAVNDYTDSTGERRLCAHLVIDAGASVTTDRLRAALSESLAGRTVPTAFLFLDALPLTKDLKVDRARLPRPGHARPPLLNEYVAPRTAREKQFTTIWSEVLEIDQVGVDDPFFDLGGDSLRAAQVVSRLRERHCIAIKLQTLFEHPTIRELASRLLDPPTTTAPKSSAG